MPGYSYSELVEAVEHSANYSDVLRYVGLRAAGGNFRLLKKWIAEWQISTAHFNPDIARNRGLAKLGLPIGHVLVAGSDYSRGHLKARLYREGLKGRACELCGQDEEWNGGSMSLILDHINGVGNDNRLENLQIVCPNCAATLPTHCGRNSPRKVAERPCLHCQKIFTPKLDRQRYCCRACGQRAPSRSGPAPETRKVERPPYAQLLQEIAATNWSAVGRKYGVSDNAVRKWVRWYAQEAEREARDRAA